MRPVSRCLNAKLSAICEHAIKLDALNDIVSAYLPDMVKNYCRVGSFNKGSLQLITDDPVWASQLRYCIPELRDKLRAAGIYQLTNIKVKIGSGMHEVTPRTRTSHISDNARHIITAQAEEIKHTPLKTALQKLAETNEKG